MMKAPNSDKAKADTRVEQIVKNNTFVNGLDSTRWDSFSKEYVGLLRKGGINVVNVTVASETLGELTFRKAISGYLNWDRRVRELRNDSVRVVRNVAQIQDSKAANAIAVIMGFQNSRPIEDDLDLIDIFWNLGVRIMQLTYNRRNFVGDGCAETNDGGLSKFGRAYVMRLHDQGIAVDLSHAGTRTAMEALEIPGAPPLMTHTNMASLCRHFRCIPDNLAAAIGSRGGVIGISGLSIFLRDDAVEKGSSLIDYLAHLEHAVEVAGIDHVGIGFDIGFGRSDQDTVRLTSTYPEFRFPPLQLRYCNELNRADKARNVIAGLLAHGFNDVDVGKIMGGNFLRVFTQAWGV